LQITARHVKKWQHNKLQVGWDHEKIDRAQHDKRSASASVSIFEVKGPTKQSKTYNHYCASHITQAVS